MKPKNIKLYKSKLVLVQQDGSETELSLKYLRDECPCANCKGETILWKTYRPVQPRSNHPEKYNVEDIGVVGDYGIKIDWKDGHNTGIYSWEYLSELISGRESGKEQNYEPLV